MKIRARIIVLITHAIFILFNGVGQTESISYSTFFGGDGGEQLYDMCVDSDGNTIISGRVYCDNINNFPFLFASDENCGGDLDAIIAKFDTTGEILFSTLLGGNGDDLGYGIACDSDGYIYACGVTSSTDFHFHNAIDPFDTTGSFIVKYSPTGEVLVSTCFGGPDLDRIYDITVDGEGAIYIIGDAVGGLPTTPDAYQDYHAGSGDAFIAKLSNTVDSILYCTYIGGTEFDEGTSIAVDEMGYVYICGTTSSNESSFPLKSAFDSTLGAFQDGFAAKFSPTFELLYSTFLGGESTDATEGDDQLRELAVDNNGCLYVCGTTRCYDYPLVNPLDSTLNSEWDGCISVLATDGSSLLFSSFWGGNSTYTNIGGIDIAEDGAFYIAGNTKDSDYIQLCPYREKVSPSLNEGFVSKFGPLGAEVIWSTYIGGIGIDGINSLQLFEEDLYLAGSSQSADFPLVIPHDSIFNVSEIVLLTIDQNLDTDCDWVSDSADNCLTTYNPEQVDSDGDNVGDSCDNCIDLICCGDANSDCQVNIGDAVYIIIHVFKGGPAADPPCCGDGNGDRDVNIGDPVYLINYVFKSGPPPVDFCCVF